MNVSATQNPFNYWHKWVNDLAWVLISPSLIESQCPTRPNDATLVGSDLLLHSDNYLGNLDEVVDWLDQLDAHPGPVCDWMASARDRRLGALFEHLLAFWIEHGPSPWHLVSRRLQIQTSGSTLGEMDFVLRDRKTGHIHGLEVAVKFYLGLGNAASMDAFVGPRVMDRLDRKWTHLVHRQCALYSHPQALIKLNQITQAQAIHPHIFIKGRLFVPWIKYVELQSEPAWIALDDWARGLAGGWWMPYTDWKLKFHDHQAIWLEKTDYFGPLSRQSIHELPRCDVGSMQLSCGEPMACAIVDPHAPQELSRGWVVPDFWPAGNEFPHLSYRPSNCAV